VKAKCHAKAIVTIISRNVSGNESWQENESEKLESWRYISYWQR